MSLICTLASLLVSQLSLQSSWPVESIGIQYCAFDPAGAQVAALSRRGQQSNVAIIDSSTGKVKARWTISGLVYHVAFLSGDTVLLSVEGRIEGYSADRGTIRFTLKDKNVSRVDELCAVSKKGLILSYGWDSSNKPCVMAWSMERRRMIWLDRIAMPGLCLCADSDTHFWVGGGESAYKEARGGWIRNYDVDSFALARDVQTDWSVSDLNPTKGSADKGRITITLHEFAAQVDSDKPKTRVQIRSATDLSVIDEWEINVGGAFTKVIGDGPTVLVCRRRFAPNPIVVGASVGIAEEYDLQMARPLRSLTLDRSGLYAPSMSVDGKQAVVGDRSGRIHILGFE